MSDRHDEAAERERRLGEVLGAYFEALEAGKADDPQSLLARHPDLADELRAFFDDRAAMERLAAPLRPAAPDDSRRTRVRYFGDYELIDELARGGMGIVYRARQLSLNRPVALKMMLAGPLAGDDELKRFRAEAEAVANLDHPNIVPIYEVGEHDGQSYFAMKLIEGASLAERITITGPEDPGRATGPKAAPPRFWGQPGPPASGPLPPGGGGFSSGPLPPGGGRPGRQGGTAGENAQGVASEPPSLPGPPPQRGEGLFGPLTDHDAARLMATVARAVHHAHQRGVLHRDLKPSNILLDASGAPHVTDFGLAKRVEGDPELTRSGAIVGTPSYMAPEQADGKRGAVTTATDVYGLGAVLYAILAGKPPFRGDSVIETLEQVRRAPPEPPSGVRRRVDRDLQTICLKCLEKEPARRYRSAEALADDLERWLRGEPIAARPAGRLEHAWRWCRRNPALAAGASTITVLLVAFLAVLITSNRTLARQQAEITRQRDRARKAVDKMYTEVAEKWLIDQPGLTGIRRDFLLEALAFYRDFAREAGTDPAVRRETALAWFRVGNIEQILERLDAARAAYRQAVAQQFRLVADYPGHFEYRFDLAATLTNLGRLLAVTGRTAEAEDAFRQTLQTGQAMKDAFPARVDDWSILLLKAYNNMGAILEMNGKPREALEALDRGLALAEELSAAHPEKAEYREEAAGILHNIGNQQKRAGQIPKALDAHRREAEVYEALAEGASGTRLVGYRSEAAGARYGLGLALLSSGQIPEAERQFQQALGQGRQLEREFPGGVGDRVVQVKALIALGDIRNRTGQPAEADAYLREALTLAESLVAHSPSRTDHRGLLGVALRYVARQQADRGDADGARATFLRGIEELRTALRSNPRDPELTGYLASITQGYLGFLARAGAHAEAAEFAVGLARERPGSVSDAVVAAEALARAALNAEQDARLAPPKRGEAASPYREQARALLNEVAGAIGDDPTSLNALAWFLAAGPDPAIRDPALAVRLAARGTELAPNDGAIWNTLGVAHYRAGAWNEAITALERSMDLTAGGSPVDWFFLAAAHGQKGERGEARLWFDKGAAWMAGNGAQDEELIRFRQEAADVLGLTPPAMPDGAGAFQGGLAW
jgi:serine/threonine protein kinase/tetratricopeptide (TPR) repeat protein